MYSFRRLALLLALVMPAFPVLLAQSSSSSGNPAANQDQAQQPAPTQTEQNMSVQARIRARRAQRRAAAIHDAYAHTYDLYATMGYLRFTPGPSLQRATMYAWDTGFTRYYSDRLGVSIDGRGYYGTAYVGLNPYGITRPAISNYAALIGPSYRFYLQPKYSLAVKALGGYARGNFSADTNTVGAKNLGLYPDSSTFAISASAIGEYNVTPNLALRLAPEYYVSDFGSKMQGDFGFTGGFVVRFGKK